MSRATATLVGFILGAASITALRIGRLGDLAEEAQRRVMTQAAYAMGKAEGEKTDDATGADERGTPTAAPAN